MRMFRSAWMIALLGSVAFLGCVVAFLQVPAIQPPPRAAIQSKPKAVTTGPSWEFINPEINQLITELKSERERLDQKERALNELADRLKTERLELNQVTQTVHSLQKEFEQALVRVNQEEAANRKRLAKMYANIESASAANILKELDDDSIVRILIFMKDDEAAPIIDALSKQGEGYAKRAALITERLRLALYRDQTSKPKS